jgi:hypothetical protein
MIVDERGHHDLGAISETELSLGLPRLGGTCGLIEVINCAPTHLISGDWR